MILETRAQTAQLIEDCATIAVKEVFDATPEQCVLFQKTLEKVYLKIEHCKTQDSKDLEYTKENIDAALKEALCEHTVPFGERYSV